MTAMSRYQPTVTKDQTGHCTIHWGTPDGTLPIDGCIAVSPELICEFVITANALVDAERMLGLRP